MVILGVRCRCWTAPRSRRASLRVTALPDRALLAAGDGFGDPEAITAWFLDQARAHGAQVVAQAITGIDVTAGRVEGVRTKDTTLPADHLVLAVGTALPKILGLVGQALAMDNRAGLLAKTSPGDADVTAMLATPDVHIWRRADGGYLMGADFGGGDPIGDARPAAEAVLANLKNVLARTDSCNVTDVTVRERPMPADGRPALGPLGPEGLYVVCTHSGMTLAPLIAQMVSAELAGSPDARLVPYRPGRSALQD